MTYADGLTIEPGDIISIDRAYRGRVVACMDTKTHVPGAEGWDYLGEGIMVDTDFGGLVHYTAETADSFVLLERPDPA